MKLQANETPRFLALFDRDHGSVLPDQRKWLEYKWVYHSYPFSRRILWYGKSQRMVNFHAFQSGIKYG
jgi:hypothetical protein